MLGVSDKWLILLLMEIPHCDMDALILSLHLFQGILALTGVNSLLIFFSPSDDKEDWLSWLCHTNREAAVVPVHALPGVREIWLLAALFCEALCNQANFP
jgi:hypothetical protein